jgi:RHS repeat-associated protein
LSDCPFRYQGQYEDVETGLYYNRFRYYSPEEGIYLSQDPIGLAGNNPTLYSYVHDTNYWLDILGLSTVYLRNNEVYVGKAKVDAYTRYGNSSTATDIFTNIPDTDIAQGVEQITYERLQVLHEQGLIDKPTNINRPVNMDNPEKTWRRQAGEDWLKSIYGDDFESEIDNKILNHYKCH